jgi:hypothetical protein
VPRIRSLAFCLASSAALLGCGGPEEDTSWKASPTKVFDRAMEAVSQADLKKVWPLLTAEAMARFQRDLEDWQQRLRDPQTGPEIQARARSLNPNLKPEEFIAARDGTIEDVWKFFLRVKPRPAKPPKTGMIRLDPKGASAEIGYVDVEGTERHVRLVQVRGTWRIDRLPL